MCLAPATNNAYGSIHTLQSHHDRHQNNYFQYHHLTRCLRVPPHLCPSRHEAWPRGRGRHRRGSGPVCRLVRPAARPAQRSAPLEGSLGRPGSSRTTGSTACRAEAALSRNGGPPPQAKILQLRYSRVTERRAYNVVRHCSLWVLFFEHFQVLWG